MKQAEAAAGTTWGIPPQIRRSIRGFVMSPHASLEEDFIRQLVTLEITPEGVGQVSAGRALNEQETGLLTRQVIKKW